MQALLLVFAYQLCHEQTTYSIAATKQVRVGTSTIASISGPAEKDNFIVADGTTVYLMVPSSSRPPVPVFKQPDPIYSVAVHRDLIAIAGWGNDIVLFDVGKRELVRTLRGHSNAVYAVAFSPDGKRLVSGSHDGKVVLWTPETGAFVLLGTHDAAVSSVSFAHDGTKVATGGYDGKLVVWNASKDKGVYLTASQKRVVRGVAFSMNDRLIAFGGDGGIADVLDVSSKKLMCSLSHKDGINCVAFLPNRTDILVTTTSNSPALIESPRANLYGWDVAEKRQAFEAKLSGEVGSALFVTQKLIYTGGDGGKVSSWLISSRPER